MASMREIKSRISATKKTSQFTKAMHMVSASKLKKAEKLMTDYRPLMYRLQEMIDNILTTSEEISHPLLVKHDIEMTCYVIVSSDRGLAGPYNSSVFKAFKAYVEEHHQSNDEFIVAPIGHKAMGFAKREKYQLLNEKPINVRDDIQFIDFREITELFMNAFLKGSVDEVIVFYNHFVNTITQQVESFKILPVIENNNNQKDKETTETEESQTTLIDLYAYEPNPQEIINHLVPMYVENTLYGIILDAKASEHAARMTAMKSATDNAQEMIHDLQLHYNRARQAAITIELTDIIGGANAVN
ncbi:MAG: ATP synthase F1 subunit gamma [Candidatus Izimaplasma sp.]|nr:ATP synthase F1 subunit gamma [Candidatus Izimaplasma bacterium]